MNQDNFIDTVCKKLNLDYSKGNVDAGDDFLELFKIISHCDYCIAFTDEPSEIAGVKKALIEVKCPAENKALFDKYGKIIVDVAKDLYGTRDGYTICDLTCGTLLPEAQVV